MYEASQAFHDAVANGAHQIALLIFDDAVFTNDDIDVSAGIEFNDYFNTDEDFAIGQALSNELSFGLFNDVGALNDYEFGDFTATIGAQIGNTTVTASGTVRADSANNTYVANAQSPYLTRNGAALATQPNASVISILIYNGIVFCRLSNGTCTGYNDSDGSASDISMNTFMLDQMLKWSGKGISFDGRFLKIWQDTNLRTYEFVPLGKFTADRPNVPYVNLLNFICYDFMQKFEDDMPSNAELGPAFQSVNGRSLTYPITFSELFKALCAYVNVPYVSATFINSTATINKRPDDFDNVTMREVMQWLAEAAASVARFDRDGRLKMDWIRTTATVLDEHWYSEFKPYWYETKRVTKLYNRASNGDYDKSTGSGDEAYLIQDNPLLKGVQ